MRRDNTAQISAPEHYESARACRKKLKGRTHQLERCAGKASEKFRLSDDWLRYVMKAFLLLSPDASRKSAVLRRILRRSTEGVHKTTDVERVECSADLLEVKGARMSSKSSPWTTGRDVLELLTTAETACNIPQGCGNWFASQTGQVSPAVYNERARPKRAGAEHVVGLV